MENVLEEKNLRRAMQCVIKRKGCAGTDGMQVYELQEFWEKHGEIIKEMLRVGTYIPAPAKRGFISKKGKNQKRKLAIPTVLDRMIQNAILLVLLEEYDKVFHPNSFGFRKGCNTYHALEQALDYMNQGYEYVADIDIKQFFDTVKHNILLNLFEKHICDIAVIKIVKKYVKMGVLVSGRIIRPRCGIIQGGPLSPLLANIVLNELDQYLEKENIKFVRYADDIVLFDKTKSGAEKCLEAAKRYLEEVLLLELNDEKSKVVHVCELEYLGYAFMIKNKNHYVLSVDEHLKLKMFQKLQKHINRSADDSIAWWQRIGAFHRGWINYYRKADSAKMLQFLQYIEQKETILLHKKINSDRNIKPNLRWKIIECKSYISLTEWYNKLWEKGLVDCDEEKSGIED